MLPVRRSSAALVVAFLATASCARMLQEAPPAPTTTTTSSYTVEYQTYKEAASIILDRGTLRVDSAEEAAEKCDTADSWASATCQVWSWCPATELDNCELSLPGQDNATLSLTPGRLVLSYDASPNAGILMVSGPDVTFISGVRSDSKFKGLTYATQLNDTGKNITADSNATFVLLPPVANDCPSTCSAQGYASPNGGAEGNALCHVTHNGVTYYGTKNAASDFCEFTDSSGDSYDWERPSGASDYQCVCVTQPAALLTWESTTDCSTLGKAPALGSPNACRVFNAYSNLDEYYGVMTEYAMGWILSSACYFPARSWKYLGVSDTKIQIVTGTTDDYKMQTLCYTPAA